MVTTLSGYRHGQVTKPQHPVLVVDFGAQYAQLIARRVREAHIYSEIVPHSISAEQLADRQPGALIFSGGPKSVHIDGSPRIHPDIYKLGIPTLGICYGAQLIAHDLGGKVTHTGIGEYGRTPLSLHKKGMLLTTWASASNTPNTEQQVWMSHFDSITHLPEDFVTTAHTPQAPIAAFENTQQRIFGVQFHPEVAHTPAGQKILEQFLYEGADLSPNWTTKSFIDEAIVGIQTQIGQNRAICGLSGGVDSAVAAALVHRAIGNHLTCVFVDTGLMRQNEGQHIINAFRRSQGIDLIAVDASERFFASLAGITEPEEKRKIIGELFIRVFEDTAEQMNKANFLVQGTLYPDVIESGSHTAAKIKSHHNVGGIPEKMNFELVEPLKDLFKDEVRAIGTELGLPNEIVWRHPFPGPGLGVRVIGEITPHKVTLLTKADAIVRAEITAAGLEQHIWQTFAVLPDIRTVGIMGDERTYGHLVVIRAVTSEDAMTADWARLPYELLEKMSNRIINEVKGINRVAYDITSKPPGTIEWE
ncbi:MAG: glutamine-hydrolyzing GMP synthase [Acidimicrobiia bacterium]|nr:glutamine-hydrolyzing GMP synthase [Acidimicrobiia bacterium]MYC58348.1 glutamine-hydrolyzing GMP synthase [Acidimicrobiia bacterium]MYI29945.1 glutamine-hydrolyzing GMP synthase [Acidimicrobiia bacterium]